MPLKLGKTDQEFRNPLIFTGEAKNIDLDRVLLNLFMLIKYHGAKPSLRTGRKEITINTIVKQLVKREPEGVVKGFSDQEDVVYAWVAANLVDLVFRGKPEKEAMVSLRSIHLNSYKYRNPKHARDYNISKQVYNMLQEAPGDFVVKLREFLGMGWNDLTKSLDPGDNIDLDTLGILRVVEKEMKKDMPSGDNRVLPEPCICPGQARVFSDDVRRLLVYQDTVPRHVLLEYLRTLIGIHVGLYLFKLIKIIPSWIKKGTRDPICVSCPVQGDLENPFTACPYQSELVVDCGNEPLLDMAKLSEEDAAFYYARVHDYIRSTFAINMALQYLNKTDHRRVEEIDEALTAMKNKGDKWDAYFEIRLQNLFASLKEDEADEVRDVFKPIIDLGLTPFETFVEVVNQARASFHYKYHMQLIDSLFQSNRETGLIWMGRSRKYKRRFWLSSRLLETMVQLSVLRSINDGDGKRRFVSEPILIDEFVAWMENRYGFIINGIAHEQYLDAGIAVHQAFKNNIINLKERLREIGFFNVLSDAHIMQRIRPRYHIIKSEEA